jgi:hypothetical protein
MARGFERARLQSCRSGSKPKVASANEERFFGAMRILCSAGMITVSTLIREPRNVN